MAEPGPEIEAQPEPDMDWEMFFTVHSGLDREGPGTAEDVQWACGLARDLAGMKAAARICDAGCGPGGDIAALLAAVPEGRVVAIDKMPGFVAEARARFANDSRVEVSEGDMAALPGGPFDLIWCAGALYFLGLQEGLRRMAAQLAPGGVLAFSEPCFFTDTPSDAAQSFWQGYPTGSESDIRAAIEAAGFEILGARAVSDAGWEAYYGPLEKRIEELRAGADDRLTAALDENAAEARDWRAVRGETGYLLSVVRLT